jgi:Flp pilus assembly protein CpaB
MKFAVVILIVLGLLAAGSAAVLIRAMHLGQTTAQASPTVEVIVAAGELPAMTVLRPENIRTEKVPRVELPRDCCLSPVQAIGRVLAVAVIQGQALRKGFFLPDSGPAASVATIPAGMRVFTISVPSRSISGGLIYPGCIVDVQATFDLTAASQGDAIATTVLNSVQVWAIEDDVVAAPQPADSDKTQKTGKTAKSTPSHSGALRVSLLVNTKQLESLQLASERESIALAIRNPLDKTSAGQAGTIFNRDFLHGLGLPQEPPPAPERAPADANVVASPAPREKPTRIVQVIEGSKVTEQPFPVETKEGGPGG